MIPSWPQVRWGFSRHGPWRARALAHERLTSPHSEPHGRSAAVSARSRRARRVVGLAQPIARDLASGAPGHGHLGQEAAPAGPVAAAHGGGARLSRAASHEAE